jgi:hypothetical protein
MEEVLQLALTAPDKLKLGGGEKGGEKLEKKKTGKATSPAQQPG